MTFPDAVPSPALVSPWPTVATLAVVAAAYLLGSVPTAGLVGRRVGVEPEREGSGNPGASNVTRLAGRRAGAAVLVGDAGKGAVAAAAGSLVGGPALGLAALCAAVVGHVWPLGRWSHGGKGVATLLGGALVLWPVVALAALLVWAPVAASVRRASVASLAAVGVLSVGVSAHAFAASGADWTTRLGTVAAAIALGALVASRHRDNLVRLAQGTEASFGGRGVRPGR